MSSHSRARQQRDDRGRERDQREDRSGEERSRDRPDEAHQPQHEHRLGKEGRQDAVIQGLSEVPNMKDVHHWGVLTIGTGLGNARFTNREDE